MTLPLSVLDLAPVCEGTPAAESVRRTVDLARLAERLGFTRYWFAEHHSLAAVASSSPEILIAHVAAHTQRIRVGSGGIMLPNHAPLRIAEAFHTLSALHPGRIDLGIGRAPGSDGAASRALRAAGGEHFSSLMSELLFLSQCRFSPGHPFHKLKVMPPDAPLPPIWILGSSGASASAAGSSGFGYSFATHFSPEPAAPAFEFYRENFRPSENFPEPQAILAVAAFCAETDEEADEMARTMDLAWLRIERGEYRPLPSPAEARDYPYSSSELDSVARRRKLAVVGSPRRVRERIEAMVEDTGANEVMIVTNVWDHEARLQSYELIAQAFAMSATSTHEPGGLLAA